jgi:hypothetical protein
MELKCKWCGNFIQDKDKWSYNYIQYQVKHIEIAPVAEGGMDKSVLDAGIFCKETCLHDYLSFEGEAE